MRALRRGRLPRYRAVELEEEPLTTDPPRDPLAEPTQVVTAAELARLHELRRHRTWHDLATASDATTFLLDLVDRLLGRGRLPGEDPWRPEEPGDRYVVESGPSLYMCGHGGYHVRVAGSWRTLLTLTAGPLDVARLRDLLNDRTELDGRR